MSIKSDYLRYLDHFGKTVTIRDFARDRNTSNLIALRHDVDHELDIALEMSYYEHRHGIQSTYYLLDTAPYWSDPELVNKCLQMTDYGHEIGLHINVLAKWFKGDISDIKLDLQAVIGMLRKGGIDVKTVSTHGDPLCYSQQFINYWCFQELRPDNPVARESGLSAEGIPVTDPKFQIHYPQSHQLQRLDGKTFQFWSVSMPELGLEYDAMHIPYDAYYSDSGGWWTRTPDPLELDIRKGRVQVLMHPEYWRGPQRLYFFLSTPRSGSTWLANFIDKATPLTGKHEFSLNHRHENKTLHADKRTLNDLSTLLNDRNLVRELLIQVRTWIEDTGQDYGEANVYLHYFIDELKNIFPEASFIFLYRDPKDVVRSLMNRDWYDTPQDERHPAVNVKNWNNLTQFQKICWFVCNTNETLLPQCEYAISFERMVTDQTGFVSDLEMIGIPVYTRIASKLFFNKINVSKRNDFLPYDQWEEHNKKSFNDICGMICRKLGYAQEGKIFKNHIIDVHNIQQAKEVETVLLDIKLNVEDVNKMSGIIYGALYKNVLHRFLGVQISKKIIPVESATVINKTGTGGQVRIFTRGCHVRSTDKGLCIHTIPQVHSSILFGIHSINKISDNEGWKSNSGNWYKGEISFSMPDNHSLVLLCFMYDAQGNLYDKRQLLKLNSSHLKRKFSFRTRINAKRFALAIYKSSIAQGVDFTLERLTFSEVSANMIKDNSG